MNQRVAPTAPDFSDDAPLHSEPASNSPRASSVGQRPELAFDSVESALMQAALAEAGYLVRPSWETAR